MDVPQKRCDAEIISRVAWQVWARRGGVAVEETIRVGDCYKHIERGSLHRQSSEPRVDLAVKEAFILRNREVRLAVF